jgi:hypothetical protein
MFFRLFQDVTYEMLLDNRFKLLTLQHIPLMPPESKAFTNDSWQSLEKRICQMGLNGSSEFNINWSSRDLKKHKGGIVIARGVDVIFH